MVTDRDEAILRHIGLYRLTIREVLATAFNLEHPGNVLQRLRDAKLIEQRSKGLPGKVSYYQLTARGAADRVSLERTKPLGGPALRQHLAVLWFCHLDTGSRTRLEEVDIRRLFDDHSPAARQAAFCVEENDESRRARWAGSARCGLRPIVNAQIGPS